MLLALAGVTTTVKAADCRVNGGNWQRVSIGGTLNLQVPVNVRLEVNEPRILLSGVRIECRFEPDSYTPDGRQDYWATGTRIGPAWSPGPKFVSQTTGLRINGSYWNTPIQAGIRIATMPNNTSPIPIDVIPYILIRNNPTNPIDIRIGDTLGVLRLDQTNNYDSFSTSLQLTYIANNVTASRARSDRMGVSWHPHYQYAAAVQRPLDRQGPRLLDQGERYNVAPGTVGDTGQERAIDSNRSPLTDKGRAHVPIAHHQRIGVERGRRAFVGNGDRRGNPRVRAPVGQRVIFTNSGGQRFRAYRPLMHVAEVDIDRLVIVDRARRWRDREFIIRGVLENKPRAV